jgi:hypothetical protein
MKVLVTEGKLGLEYIADAISSCEQNGIECIADDENGVILFYDPRGHKYADSKYLMNADTTIHELLQDSDLYETTMKNAEGDGFKEFSVQWNSLQKKEDGDDVYKSKTCNPIRGNFTEGYEDDPRDWSASEGEVEIMWTRDFPEAGIEAGNTDNFVVDYDLVLPNDYDMESNCLKEEVCNLIRKEYPDLDFDETDFDITNEREFWGDEASRHIYPYDESDGEFETMADIDDEQVWNDVGIDDNDNVVEGIPNWATCYIMYGDDSNLTPEDVAMVDKFVQDLEKDGLRLSHPISGSENEFNSYPAFGDACDTSDWSCEIG